MIIKDYIKMCEKAEEIQKAWKPKIGDYVSIIDFSLDEIYIISKMQSDEKSKMYRIDDINNFSSLFEMENILHKKYIYLPTQEQLQEIAGYKYTLYFLISLKTYYINRIVEKDEFFGLVEEAKELLLNFIMQEKYNKIWNGTNWIGGQLING